MRSSKSKAQDFINISAQFKLGHLDTESFHSLTDNLSNVVKKNVSEALKILQEVDRRALEILKSKVDIAYEMSVSIQDTLKSGNKVFMVGCGATGRLSLVLETLYRQQFPNKDNVFAFMAGGDFALIKSVESFEDKVEYGERQLLELGFGKNDLLLSPTEGGETPFVIGATNLAAKTSSRSPYFLYCNPDELLMPIDRSREVIENKKIKKVNLAVGPMGISGSTRMQASTVLMLVIGVGLLYEHQDQISFKKFYLEFLNKLVQTDYQVMGKLTTLEAKLYEEKKYLNYVSSPNLAISILTDTTERSPTFSLRGFENISDPEGVHSLSYLFIDQSKNSKEAWHSLLCRNPRALEWSEFNGRIGSGMVHGFDISLEGLKRRAEKIPTENFYVLENQGVITLSCMNEKVEFNWNESALFNHLMLKMLLNAHSTLIMGLLGRYEGNVMTWVRASNNKLIDRAARYVLHLLDLKKKTVSYEAVVEGIFEELEDLQDNEPIVLKVLKRFN